MSIQAIILAGGIGKRIAPLGINKPKAMFKVMGKPLIRHVLESVQACGMVEKAVVVVGPGESQIEEYLTQNPLQGLEISFTVQEKPLGQANALETARNMVEGSFLVLNANDIYDPALLTELAQKGIGEALDVSLVGRAVDEPSKFGVMAFDGNGRLSGVVEKPRPEDAPSKIAVIGLYFFSENFWKALDATPAGQTDDQLERAYSKLIEAGGGGYIAYDGPFASYKYPWDLLAINELMLKRIDSPRIAETARISPLAVMDGNIVVEEGVRIFENAIIRGPAYIGSDSIIGNQTLIRGGTSIGSFCVVGFGTEISHSILGDHCWTHKNFIGDSIISDNCSFGAGTITANLRFDEGPVKVRVGEQRIATGMPHFGTIMAEDCRTGCNVVLLPGTKMGPNSAIGPGVVLDDDLPSGKIALLQKGSYRIKENEVDIHQLSRAERMKSLKKG
ncbi:MAG: NTP transferase domain-containing protein [Anaerolineales bacterium]|nr:NTP transferase domain-containing protein [Anaerolineales bacterium]